MSCTVSCDESEVSNTFGSMISVCLTLHTASFEYVLGTMGCSKPTTHTHTQGGRGHPALEAVLILIPHMSIEAVTPRYVVHVDGIHS